jgi:hypothetical protein
LQKAGEYVHKMNDMLTGIEMVQDYVLMLCAIRILGSKVVRYPSSACSLETWDKLLPAEAMFKVQ